MANETECRLPARRLDRMTTIPEPHLVTRSLKVTEMVCPKCDEIIVDALSGLGGMRQVQPEWRKNRVTVTYDLRRVRIQEVEIVLEEIGYRPDPQFFHRAKRDWTHFTEKNERDNLKHIAPCCSKPPVGR